MITLSEIEWLKEIFNNYQGVVENEYTGAGYSAEEMKKDRDRAEAIFAKLLKEVK